MLSQGKKQLLNFEFHQVISTEDSTTIREHGPLTVNSIVKTSK